MLTVTAANLFAIAPGADPDIVSGIVENQSYIAEAGILDTEARAARFFAQIAHESTGFTRLLENMNYTAAARIRQVWPTRFPTELDAVPYVRQPQKLGNKVYGGRLGNTGPNDGWIFRGRGLIQNTGRANYREMGQMIGVDLEARPELVSEFPYALQAAVAFWKQRALTALADRGATLEEETRLINGGLNGIDDRRVYFNRANKVRWGDGARAAPPPQAEYVRRGAAGTKVRQIQEALRAKGFYRLATIDGVYGDVTEDGVRAFQASRGLQADGVVGPVTWEALMAGTGATAPQPRPDAPPAAPTGEWPEPSDAPSLPGWVAAIIEFFKKLFGKG